MSARDDTGRAVLRDANCTDHPTDLAEDEIEETIAARQWCYCEERGEENCGPCCDTAGAALYRLKDGRFATATESSDTTGHG